MKTAIPFAVEERTTEPRIERAITITTPPASSSPGPTFAGGAGKRARVDVDVCGRRDRRQPGEHVVVRKPEEDEEHRRQQDDDREHLPAQGLPEAVARDREHGAHDTSSPTASRYVSSSVDV